jgi:hypothetical protein
VFRWLQWFKRKPLIVGEAPREGIDPDDVQVGTLYRLAHASGKVRCRVDAIESRALLGDCGYCIVVFAKTLIALVGARDLRQEKWNRTQERQVKGLQAWCERQQVMIEAAEKRLSDQESERARTHRAVIELGTKLHMAKLENVRLQSELAREREKNKP